MGTSPKNVAFDSSNGNLYVTNDYTGNVTVINGTTNAIIGWITVGSVPIGIAFDSSNGNLYVTNQQSNNVTIIDGNTGKTIGSITVGENPYGISIDSSNSKIFVNDYTSGSISIISPPQLYTATFIEGGLPAGTPWYVSLSNGMKSGVLTVSSYSFSLPNGTYSYTISTTDKIYSSSPSYGSLTVNGSSVSNSVSFSTVLYAATFTETGLPSGTSWSVTLNGTTQTSTTSSITFSEINGTYAYTVSTTDKTYSTIQYSGTITVNGGAVPVSVPFTEVNYTATFAESGLPSGYTWYVNLSNGVNSGAITGTSYSFSLPNGTYSYTISTTDKIYASSLSSGTITVNGGSVSNLFTFSKVFYSVSFTESGLPSGTTWSVTLNGTTKNSTSSTISFTEINGTYLYIISITDKIYSPTSPYGSVSVNGNPVSDTATFSAVSYTAAFTETGLSSGTAWYVNLSNGNTSGAITGTAYSFSLTNGSYTYTISTSDRIYSPSPSSGTFTVNGASVSNSVKFSIVNYSATFTESGLPSGTLWYVNLSNGMKSGAINGTSYSFTLTNGSYSYNIATTDKIYHANAGSITVNGKNMKQAINFTKFTYAVTFKESSLPSGITWYVNLTNGIKSGPITGSSYSFNLSNGSYSFSTTTAGKSYLASPSSGTFTVNGASVSNSISFTEIKFTVTFTESGLAANTTWYVNLSDGIKSGPITGTSFTLNLTNGTYTYTVSNVTGYTNLAPSGNISVNGNNLSEAIAFTQNTSAPGISGDEVYGAIGAIVVVAAVLSILVILRKKS